jgi:zinc/manganese transport system substrate-binding protein
MRPLAVAALAVLAAAPPARAAVNVMASTEDLADLTRQVGGDKAKVETIAKGYQDPHFVEAKPSFILKLAKADLLVVVGRELEIGWLPPLIQQSRNAKIQVGADGYLDASLTAKILEIPTGQITRAMGDVHPQGNPHYWLDPDNGVIIATAIADAFARADAGNAAAYQAGLERFRAEIERRKPGWQEKAQPLSQLQIVTYHDTWPYFCRTFGLEVVGWVEPLPGIEPTPSHTAALIEMVKGRNIRIIGVEPYKSRRTPDTIARATGAKVIDLPPSVGGAPGADDYYSLFDVIIDRLLEGAR